AAGWQDRALASSPRIAARNHARRRKAPSVSTRRILVLAKKSALRVHLEGQDVGRHERVEELLRVKDITVARMRGAHKEHEATLAEVQDSIAALGCEAKLVMA